MKRRKKDSRWRRRERLFKLHPYCHWCGVRLIPAQAPTRSPAPLNMATLDHLHSRLSGKRNPANPLSETRLVLACWACNNKRGHEETVGLLADEHRRRTLAGNVQAPQFGLSKVWPPLATLSPFTDAAE